ncbi:MAG: zf-HC2 domain-containing protein [Deltaproteobacteria bacterium]|nr:zf-HC2 domain-containing protein [Deltaproteobacteria bacterium]
MTCATWQELTSSGARLLREGSPERQAAERHLAGCPECSERAFLLDPSWAVRPIGSECRSPSEGFSGDEIEALKRSVLEGGRIRTVEDRVRRKRFAVNASVAAVLACALLAGGVLMRSARPGDGAVGFDAMSPAAGGAQPSGIDSAVPSSVGGPSAPAVASLVQGAARVYDLGQPDFTLVMVVDETLDI